MYASNNKKFYFTFGCLVGCGLVGTGGSVGPGLFVVGAGGIVLICTPLGIGVDSPEPTSYKKIRTS